MGRGELGSTLTPHSEPGAPAQLAGFATLTLALTYGGGLWLHLLHLAGDGFHAPHSLADWLRDSTYTLPLVSLAVWLALHLAGWAARGQARMLHHAARSAVLAALLTSLVAAGAPLLLAAGLASAQPAAPAANLFFCSLAGAATALDAGTLPIGQAALRDAILTLLPNLALALAAYVLACRLPAARQLAAQLRRHAPAHLPARPRMRRAARLGPPTLLLALLAGALPAPTTTNAAVTAASGPSCRSIFADVVALDQTIVYNRLGVLDPAGMIFALRRDVVDKSTGLSEADGGALTPGNVQLRSDKRPRPLTLRMNVGDCLQIQFQNLLSPIPVGSQPATRNAGISVLGLQLKGSILSDGSNVGANADTTGSAMAGLAAPGDTTTYTFYAEREGAYELYSPADNSTSETIGTLAHGLFGAVNVEPRGAEWYRSQVSRDDMDLATVGSTADGHPIIDYDAVYPSGHRFAGTPILNMLDGGEIVHSDLTAVITGPGRGAFTGAQPGGGWYPANASYPNRNQPFREFTIVFHDEIAMTQAFPEFEDPAFEFTLHGVRDGKGINYGTGGIAAEVLANRKGVGPAWDCPECKLEEFFLTSWALGDPSMIVDVPANSTDANGDLVVGPKATKAFYPDDPSNVYHTYINDHTKFRNIHIGKEHHIFHLHSHQWLQTPDDDNSSYLDSQAIGPGASYTYEIAYGGSGNRNKTPGDAIFHCHFYPHFAQGMWAMWRNHDVFERGTKLDANGLPLPGERALPDGEIAAGTPTPGLVPLPGLAMAPMPGGSAQIVGGQVDADGNGVADHAEGFAVAPSGNPGYPYYIPGIAGHRPPTPALDMTEPLDMGLPASQRRVYHGGLPRHIISGGTALSTLTPLDMTKELHEAAAVFLPEQGTPAEQAAMAFHAQLRHDTFLPDGTPASGGSGFEANGLPPMPGAPYAEPCRLDNGSFNSAAPLRTYKAADIQLDMKLNKLGWHFPQARMLSLWQDVGPYLSGARAPEPFVMRANSGDCINYYHTNLIPGVYEQDAYQVRTPTDIIGQHIHLVKFDVTASDGSGNGFNYEDGALSPDDVRERIAAIRRHNGCAGSAGAPGDTTCPVAAAHAFFGPGPNGRWLGARTTIQRWWADPVLNNAGVDRTLGNVYTHDHYGPSTHQQTGLYATLIIEPAKSLWRDAETGACHGDTSLLGRSIPGSILAGGCTPVARSDGGPTSWRADILTPDNAGVSTNNYDKQSYREYYFEFSDFQHAYVAGKGGSVSKVAVTIGGKSYSVQVPGNFKPDALYAINPAGAKENNQVSTTSPWLKVKPTLAGQADGCPSNPDMSFVATGCPESISTADVGTFSMNYRNEPIGARVLDPATMSQATGDAGDLSLAFASSITRKDARLNSQPSFYPALTADVKPGDPYTPMMRAYEGDPIRIRVQVGATEEGHIAGLWGNKWLQEFASPNSGWRGAQMMGISEQFNWDAVTAIDPALKGIGSDYVFSPDNSTDGLWNGMWSLLRSYSKYRVKKNTIGTDLLPLPSNRLDSKTNQVNTVSNLSAFDSKVKYQCPTSAPKVTLAVTAVLARDALPGGTLVYNSRAVNGGPLHDPTAILYVRSGDLDASGKLKPGVPIEPLVLRARAGDCINLQLSNRLPATSAGPLPQLPGYNALPPIIDRHTVGAPATALSDSFNANDLRPSNRVGLRPQLLAFDTTRGGGNSVGGNGNTTVVPGATGSYWWYAGDLSYNVATGQMTATPIEFGATNLISSDPLTHPGKGAIGALIIEPQGASWVEDAASRASATVTQSNGAKFRDFVLQFQDDLNLRFGLDGALADGGPLPFVGGEDDAEDTGMKGLNYRTEPLWYRLGIDPQAAAIPADAAGGDVHTGPNLLSYDFTNALANSLVGGDPQTPVFTAAAGMPIRLRVLQAGGHARNHVFALHGHVWERNPYSGGSTRIGDNWMSQWVGSQEGHGPTNHWDIVPKHGAGGAYGVKGDYLYRDMAPGSYYNGVWGILRVQ